MKKLIIYIILLSFTFSSCSKPNKQNIENDKNATHNKKIIATWVTYEEIKMLIDATNSKNDFINLIYEKLNVLKNYKVNTIFLHVRAFDDCFYKSDIYPVSIYCSNKDGSLKYDVLEIFINICKLLDIKLHAWVNPYRIRNDSAINKINENTLAYKFINNKSEKIIITENVIYYNPAYVDIQKYIIDGIKEILENYSVDGIHIDDYFYPTTSTMIDNSIFTSYTVSGGKLSLNDFRRRNIDSLISSIYSLVKSYGDICFSISPNGDINKNYNVLFADVKKWLKEDGYVDYIIPQIYYGYENADMPFKSVINEWIHEDNSKIIIGLGLYKSGKKDNYAKSGENEWIFNYDIISRQIKDVYRNNYAGLSVFSSLLLTNKSDNSILEKEKINIIKTMEIYET